MLHGVAIGWGWIPAASHHTYGWPQWWEIILASPFHLSVPGRRKKRNVYVDCREIQGLQFQSASLKKLLYIFSPQSLSGSTQEGDRSGTVWQSSLPLSPSSFLGRPWAPRRTGDSPVSTWELAERTYAGRFSKRPWDGVLTSCRAQGPCSTIGLWVLMGQLVLHGPSLWWVAGEGGRWRGRGGAVGMTWNPPADAPWTWLWPGRRRPIQGHLSCSV